MCVAWLDACEAIRTSLPPVAELCEKFAAVVAVPLMAELCEKFAAYVVGFCFPRVCLA